jgi:hypothetical protein
MTTRARFLRWPWVLGTLLAILAGTTAAGGQVGEVALPIGIVITLVLGGMGYGITKQKVDAAHRRLDEQSARTERFETKIDTKLDTIEKLITDLRIDFAGGGGE